MNTATDTTIKRHFPHLSDADIGALTAAEKSDIVSAIESRAPSHGEHEAPPEGFGELLAWFTRVKTMGPPPNGAKDFWPGVVRAAADAEEAILGFYAGYRRMATVGVIGKTERVTNEKRAIDFADAAVPANYALHFRGKAGWTIERVGDHVYLHQGAPSRAEALLWLDGHMNRLRH